MQSHLLGISPTYGPVTEKLVEYGIARLRKDHKGHIVEPLAFLSVMKWLQTQNAFNLQFNLGSRSSRGDLRGSTFEEAVNLYLLRQLRYPVPFTTIFEFHDRCIPSWAKEKAHIVARQDYVDVAVGLLGDALPNPELSVVHYASCIKEVKDWVDNPNTASVLLSTSNQFGPDVMARCQISSPTNRTVLLMGQLKSYTTGNDGSLDAATVARAITSLNPNHWFKCEVCHFLFHCCPDLIKNFVEVTRAASGTNQCHREI